MNETDPTPSPHTPPALQPGTGSPCPSDTQLSRFIDGLVDAAERDVLLDHIEQCDDCRDVVATVVQSQSELSAASTDAPGMPAADPAPLQPWIARMPAWRWIAAAATVALVVRAALPTSSDPADPLPGDPWASVAEAVGAERAVEARLSLLPEHRPLASPTRAEAAAAPFRILALASRLTEAAATAPEGQSRTTVAHAAAVATLLAGRADEAARSLAALTHSTSDPVSLANVQSDLSAAHAASNDWAAALAAAREARRVVPDHVAARFNEALALERAGRAAHATAAWRAFADDAGVDPAWRAEARRHVDPDH